jgi:VCBS repeat-containing protein
MGLGGGPSAPTPIAPVLPDESVEAMAAVSGSGSGGPGSVVAETSSSGFTINLIFDAAAMAAPASFRAGIEQAAAILSATITNQITVNINIDYHGTGGGAFAGPTTGQFVNYSTVRADLIANAAPGDTSFNALPTGSTIQGQSQVAVWNAQLKLFGLISPTASGADGSASFATDINPNLLVGVALHELTHAIGRVPYGQPDGPQPDIFDFYRFTSQGTYLFTDNKPASSSYFSLSGGATKLADFGVNSDPSDFLNSGVQGSNDAFDEFYSSSTLQSLTAVDKQILDALGFNTLPPGLAVVSNPNNVLQGGSAIALLTSAPAINDPSSTLSSATIKIANAGGNAVSGDQLFVNGIQNGTVGNGVTASWNATTNTLTLTGAASVSIYDTLLSEVTFQDTGTDTSNGGHPVRTVSWTINDGVNSYNAISQTSVDRAPVAANDTGADAVGATLTKTAATGVLSNDTDLDADRLTVTGVSDTAHGGGTVGSALAGAYGHLTLNADGSYSYVADITAAIGAAPTGSRPQDVFSYTISDANGGTGTASLAVALDRPVVVTAPNVTLSPGQTLVAASSLFSAADPDGDAITTYAFKDTGGGHFVLNGVVQPNNQEIDVSAAQLSQLTYQATIGTTDTLQVRVAEGTSWSGWQSFTVVPTVAVDTAGVTHLIEVGNDYFLNPTASGNSVTGPELMYNGAPVTAGEWSGWTLIGAEKISSGYDVAFYNAAAGLFNIWTTDNNGNYISTQAGGLTGTSSTLENFETVFQQDLNNDGTIGPPAAPPPPSGTVIEAHGVTALVQVGSNYFLNPVAGGTGPELIYNGAPVTVGEWAGWAVIGAEKTTSGYDVALYNAAAGVFNIWTTDNNGNYISTPAGGLSGTSATLENFETVFQQDLNGDSIVGPPASPPPPPSGTVIEAHGVTALVQVGSDYFLNPVAGGTGPELMYNGAPVTVGEWAGWAVVGAEKTSSGYDVAFFNASVGTFNIWSLDNNGNYISTLAGGLSGTSATLENFETVFQQDLNGDGTTGPIPPPPPPPPTTIEAHGVTALLQSGSNYFLNPVASGNTIIGPELKYNGAPVTVGEWAGWAVVAAEKTASGYDIAFFNASLGTFNIWTTDNNGNYVSTAAGGLTGSSSTLKNFESVFQQDLNLNGTVGSTAPAQVATNPTPDNFHFAGDGSGAPQGIAFSVHLNSLIGQSAASPGGAPAMGGHDGFVFALDSIVPNGSNPGPASDTMPSNAIFATNHAALAGIHQDTFSIPVTQDAAHGPLWLTHHSDFHLM